MIAARRGLDHPRLSRRVEAGEQHRRLHLGGRNRQPVLDRQRMPGTDQRKRQAAAAARHELRAHQLQRLDDPPHGAAPERAIAGQEGREPVARADARKQAHGGPGIAEVEHGARLGQPADAHPVHAPEAVVGPLDGRPESAKRTCRRHHVVAFEQAAGTGFAHRERAQHQHAVGDGLVARHGAGPRQRAGSGRNQGVQFGVSGAIPAARARRGHGVSSTARLRVKRRNFNRKFALTEKRQAGIGDGHGWTNKKWEAREWQSGNGAPSTPA